MHRQTSKSSSAMKNIFFALFLKMQNNKFSEKVAIKMSSLNHALINTSRKKYTFSSSFRFSTNFSQSWIPIKTVASLLKNFFLSSRLLLLHLRAEIIILTPFLLLLPPISTTRFDPKMKLIKRCEKEN